MRGAPAYRAAAAPPAGFVLAGGKSTRMGRDKALLESDGLPLVVRAALLVKAATGSAVIIGDPQRYGALGFPAIGDSIPGLGPMGGLLTALEHTVADWNLLVACDMPAVTAEVLKRLILMSEKAAGARAIVPVSEHGPQPLCALYHRGCLSQVRAAVERKSLKMQQLTDELRALQIDGFDPRVFDNVNRPADWSSYKTSS